MTCEELRQNFSVNLSNAIYNMNITQEELSKRTCISIRTIRRYLNAEIEPRLWELEKLAEALDTTRYSLIIM